jgi:tRNA-2-methylthio-N6-dimethylallyladenosine synthase
MKLKKVRSDKQKNKTANNQLLSGITYVTHLGKSRIPTLFPQLLDEIASISSEVHIDFISSNPWDFSDDLIEVIRKHSNISRNIHLPVQSGDDTILKKMNRWYTRDEYMGLIKKIKEKIEDVSFSTDIIVGFCGETEEQFQHTVDLVRAVGFYKAYVSMYSDRPMTTAHKHFYDDVPYGEKKRRWKILEDLINKAYQNNSIV